MSKPDLSAVVRQVYALAVAIMLPAGALLLSAGWRNVALGLCCGGLVALLNASMLVRRIDRAAEAPRERATTIMSQGQTLRFSMVLLATVVIIKLDPASIPSFVLGLLAMMVLAIATAARAVYRTCPDSPTAAPRWTTRPKARPIPLLARQTSDSRVGSARWHGAPPAVILSAAKDPRRDRLAPQQLRAAREEMPGVLRCAQDDSGRRGDTLEDSLDSLADAEHPIAGARSAVSLTAVPERTRLP